MPNRLSHLAPVIVTIALLCGAAAALAQESAAANGQAARITDTQILSDRKTLQALQDRLTQVNNQGVPVRNYSFAKAQCWLDTAKTQFHENDRTGYIEQAMVQSSRIIEALEADKRTDAGRETPLIAGSDRLREDLWSQFDALKTGPGAECAAQTVACAEVRLVRAGHANEQTGWRQASPHIAMVEDALQQAHKEAAACPVPAAVAPPAPPLPLPVLVPSTERFVLASDSLFLFGKSDIASMLPAGRTRLQAIVDRVKAYERVDRISVLGFTDRIGSDVFNQKLSQARANTIKAYFQQRGITADITAVGKGKSPSPVKNCPDSLGTDALHACLQPDRRVELEVVGTVQSSR